MGLSMYPSWYMDLTGWVTSSATCLVWSSSSSSYVSLSERCSKPVSMYFCLSCIKTVDPLLMIILNVFPFILYYDNGSFVCLFDDLVTCAHA